MSLNLLVPCLDCGQDVVECGIGVFPRSGVVALQLRDVSPKLYHDDEWS